MSLRGSFEELPLADLLEMTAVGGKTGRLTVCDEHGVIAGRLAFRDGRLVGAVCGELGAEKAFYALLALRKGTFDFDPSAALDEDGSDLSIESLLLEGMRRLDETRQLRRRLPTQATVRLQGGDAQGRLEERLLGYLGPGARKVGDIVDGLLVGGDADEYDALQTLERLAARGVVRVEKPAADSAAATRSPQPELER